MAGIAGGHKPPIRKGSGNRKVVPDCGAQTSGGSGCHYRGWRALDLRDALASEEDSLRSGVGCCTQTKSQMHALVKAIRAEGVVITANKKHALNAKLTAAEAWLRKAARADQT